MSVGQIAAIIAAVAFVVLVLLLAIPLVKLGKTLDEATIAIRKAHEGTGPLLDGAGATITTVNAQLERVDGMTASAQAVGAVHDADWVILGPGSWFTSVMPHLLVPDLCDALTTTRARRLLTLNLEMQTTETAGFSAEQHIESMRVHAPDMRFDAVLADPAVVDDEPALAEQCARLGATLLVTPVGRRDRPGEHDPLRFAAALRDILATPRPAR